jgi:HNH endonuclease
MTKGGPIPDLTPPEIGRFCTKIRLGGCGMLWDGPVNNRGYGRFEIYRDGKRIRILAHRLAYKLATGKDPAGKEVRHGCDNPPCVTPECLKTGTQADNMRDAAERGRANTSGLGAFRDARSQAARARATASAKPCTRCGEIKPMAEFGLSNKLIDGRENTCKACRKEQRRARAA